MPATIGEMLGNFFFEKTQSTVGNTSKV